MQETYYTLPLNAKRLIGRKAHDSCNLMQSVANYIHLVNTSCFGECSFDESFGCSIWMVDFDNLKNVKRLKEYVQESIYESLTEHEKRLSSLRVHVKIKQEELLNGESSNAIKKRVDIEIKGKLKKTNEDFSYVEYFYIGPLSY